MSETSEERGPKMTVETAEGPVKTLLGHLEDLRGLLIKVGITVSAAWMACFYFGPYILLFLQQPLKWSGVPDPEKFLKVFGPADAFSISFQLALYAGIMIASPFLIYFIAVYIFPALTHTERRHITPALWVGIPFFLAGVFFCYRFVLPPSLRISREFAAWLHLGSDFWTVESYVSFTTKFMLGMGIAFEVPLVLLALVRFGVLDYAKLSKARPYVIVLNFFLGAVLTTPEVFTQLIMAIPLTIMYEAVIWITWFMERRKERRSGGEGGRLPFDKLKTAPSRAEGLTTEDCPSTSSGQSRAGPRG
jgi:sec-independent protein translocase protein TatC